MAPYGVMSYYIHDRLDIGDTIEVSQPAGDFWFQASVP
jgi:ferredoxin-NADP reductase